MSNIKRRTSKLEEKIEPGKLPRHEQGFAAWDTKDSTAEEKLEKRKNELMARYGTIEGFHPILVKFTKPEE